MSSKDDINLQTKPSVHQNIVGLVPAAGQGTRIAPLPCSKELYPVGFQVDGKGRTHRPKVACEYLIKNLRVAGITKAYIVLRKGKWDIPQYLGDGRSVGMDLAYLITNIPFGVPYTLDRAFPFVQDALVALGFPDILLKPDDAFDWLLDRQISTNADAVLGLFLANRAPQTDAVEFDDEGRIRLIKVKASSTHLSYTWIIALWQPVFTRFMHEYLPSVEAPEQNELVVSDVINAAIINGLHIQSVILPQGSYIDIGTPEGLVQGVRSEIGTKVQAQHFSD